MEVSQVKAALKERFDTVAGVKAVYTYEPKSAPNLPFISIMSSGLMRRGIDTNEVQGTRVVDPLGGQTWVWIFNVRLWVSLKTNEQHAQLTMDTLLKAIVEALDEDASLGGIAVDSAISSAEIGVTPDQSNPLFVAQCDCAVEWTENT